MKKTILVAFILVTVIGQSKSCWCDEDVKCTSISVVATSNLAAVYDEITGIVLECLRQVEGIQGSINYHSYFSRGREQRVYRGMISAALTLCEIYQLDGLKLSLNGLGIPELSFGTAEELVAAGLALRQFLEAARSVKAAYHLSRENSETTEGQIVSLLDINRVATYERELTLAATIAEFYPLYYKAIWLVLEKLRFFTEEAYREDASQIKRTILNTQFQDALVQLCRVTDCISPRGISSIEVPMLRRLVWPYAWPGGTQWNYDRYHACLSELETTFIEGRHPRYSRSQGCNAIHPIILWPSEDAAVTQINQSFRFRLLASDIKWTLHNVCLLSRDESVAVRESINLLESEIDRLLCDSVGYSRLIAILQSLTSRKVLPAPISYQ